MAFSASFTQWSTALENTASNASSNVKSRASATSKRIQDRGACLLDHLRRGVDADHFGTGLGDPCGQMTRAAAEVEDLLPRPGTRRSINEAPCFQTNECFSS